MLTITHIFQAFQIGIFAYVFCCLLTKPNYIFEWYYDLLVDLEQRHKWLAYPLGICEKCFAGQLALWTWLHFNWKLYLIDSFAGFLSHCLFIAFSILFAHLAKTHIK